MLSAVTDPGGSLFYWPGFCVAESGLNVYVEVSDGQNEAAMRSLRDAWRASTPHRLAVLYRDDLRVLMTRANHAVFRKQLQVWAR